MSATFNEQDRCERCGYMRWHGDGCPRCTGPTKRPTTSNADEWNLWLQDYADTEPAYIAVQIVEAIEEHQRALAREVYGLAEDTSRYGDVAMEDRSEGHYYRGRIDEAKSIARAINAIMPYSRDPGALAPTTEEEIVESPATPDSIGHILDEKFERLSETVNRIADERNALLSELRFVLTCIEPDRCQKARELVAKFAAGEAAPRPRTTREVAEPYLRSIEDTATKCDSVYGVRIRQLVEDFRGELRNAL